MDCQLISKFGRQAASTVIGPGSSDFFRFEYKYILFKDGPKKVIELKDVNGVAIANQ